MSNKKILNVYLDLMDYVCTIMKDYVTSKYYEDNEDQTPEHLLFNRYLNKKLKKILVTDNYFRMPKEHKPLSNIYQFMFEKMIKYINIYYRKLID